MLTTVASGRVFDYSYCIGMYSQSGQGFWAPQDFVLGRNGRIYVLSRGVEQLGQRISKLDFDQQFQGQFGSVGAEDGRFVWPRSIELDNSGRVFVSDEHVNRITIFDGEGAYRYHWGRPGTKDGEFNGPSGIAFVQSKSQKGACRGDGQHYGRSCDSGQPGVESIGFLRLCGFTSHC